MHTLKPTPVPPPSTARFESGINHPELWLWDSWTTEWAGTLHLYALALARTDGDGQPVSHANRNDHPFHVRHFISTDGGESWHDRGLFMQPQDIGDGAFARNVWSGCVLARENRDWVFGFTGVRQIDASRPFVQTICLGHSRDGSVLDRPPLTALSCPVRDYDQIRDAGYYLPAKEALGANDGEEGGPILAWRDPFVLPRQDGRLDVFWSAKVAPARGAVAHATVREDEAGFHVETLHPPMTLPDDSAFTQAEVPKIYPDLARGEYYMIISACDRLQETQPAEEVTKVLRLYRSRSLRGPWVPAFPQGRSLIPGTENLFGGSILRTDFDSDRLYLIAPYTEYASRPRQLTFASVRPIQLSQGEVGTLTAVTPQKSS